MKPIRRAVLRGLRALGYDLVRWTPPTWSAPERPKIPEGARLDVGCGANRRQGFLGCDTRPLEGVSLVCKAWEVAEHCKNLGQVYSRHTLEHLSLAEAGLALRSWFEALAPGGRVTIVVPNLIHHLRQLLEADWSEEELADRSSPARWGFAGVYGWQRECDPTRSDYSASYWDCHKSGYDERLLGFLLARAGFEEIRVEVEDEIHLVARAVRPDRTPARFRQLPP